jgi:hypothetical protein
MKNTRRFFLLVSCILAIGVKIVAQDSVRVKTNDSTITNLQDSLKQFEKELDELMHPTKSYFQIEVAFLSNNVFFGRKDSVATPYITPSVGYYHKSGLYINALASYLPTSGQNRFDLFTVEAGYAHKFGNFDLQLTGNKFFYSSSSYNVESEIEADAVAAFDYNFKFITPVVQGMIIFGPRTDYAASLGLEHSFYAMKNKLTITPSVVANASTQNYYNSYYALRRYAIPRLKELKRIVRGDSITLSISANVIDPSKFKLLDYELSLPVSYAFKKFTVSFTPVYAIPTSPSQIHLVIKTISGVQLYNKTFTEKLNNSFFFQASIGYKISKKAPTHFPL